MNSYLQIWTYFQKNSIIGKQWEVKSPVSVKFSLTHLHGTIGYLFRCCNNWLRNVMSNQSLSFIRTTNVPCGSKNGRHADSTQASWKTKLKPKYKKLAGRGNRKSIQKLRSNTQTKTRVRCRETIQENTANTGLVISLFGASSSRLFKHDTCT